VTVESIFAESIVKKTEAKSFLGSYYDGLTNKLNGLLKQLNNIYCKQVALLLQRGHAMLCVCQ